MPDLAVKILDTSLVIELDGQTVAVDLGPLVDGLVCARLQIEADVARSHSLFKLRQARDGDDRA